MSVANILGADGKIKGLFLPASDISGGLTNPLTTDLQCGGFEVQQASYVRTNIVECETLEPKFPQTFVECVGDFSVAPTKVLDVDTIGVDVLQARTGSEITTEDILNVKDRLRIRGDPIASLDFEDLSGVPMANIAADLSGNLYLQNQLSGVTQISSATLPTLQFEAGGGPAPKANIVYNDVSGSVDIDKKVAITSDAESGLDLVLPSLGFQSITFKNTTNPFEGSLAYIHTGVANGQFQLSHSTVIRSPIANTTLILAADGATPVSNGQLTYDGAFQRLRTSRSLEVRGLIGDPSTSLIIGPVANQVALTYTQATSTLSANRQVQFDNFAPRTSIAPTIGDSLTNKTYVDGGVRFKSTREYYVSKQGSDITGNGSANAPFLTIQKAIDEAQLLVGGPSTVDVINVGPGLYVENLLMTRGFMTIQGNNETFRPAGTTTIQGQIVITLGGADDLFTKTVNITGLSLNGSILDNSTCQHSVGLATLNIQNTTGAAPAVLFQPSAGMTDARLYVDRCFINHQVNTAAVSITVGQLYMSNTLIDVSTNNSALALLDNAIGASGGVASQVVLCQFANSNNSATIAPLVLLDSNNPNIHAFGVCSFIYSNATVKSGSPNSSGILFEGANNMTANVAQCVFALAGTTHPANSVIMKSAAATGTMVLFNTANEALNGLAHKVDSGIVKLNSTAVN